MVGHTPAPVWKENRQWYGMGRQLCQRVAFTCHSQGGRAADTPILVGSFAGVLATVNNLGSQDFQGGDIICRPNRTLVTFMDFSSSFEPLEADIGGTMDLTGEFGEVAQGYFQVLNSPPDHWSSCKGKQRLLALFLTRHLTFFFSF